MDLFQTRINKNSRFAKQLLMMPPLMLQSSIQLELTKFGNGTSNLAERLSCLLFAFYENKNNRQIKEKVKISQIDAV